MSKRSKIDPELDWLLQEEKKLTADWYNRMSGQIEWSSGEHEAFAVRFAELDRRIDEFWKSETVEWFAALPG